MVDNRGPKLVGVASTFVSLAFTSILLRIYVRTRIVRAFGWDDALMSFAMLSYIMFATCAIAGVHWGTGRHIVELDAEQFYKAMRYWWLCYIAYCFTMIGAKLSIGIFLLRITVKPIHRWIIYTAMSLSVVTGLMFFFATLFQCAPISFFWDKNITGGSCIDINIIIGLTFAYSAVSFVSDATFGILPIFLVWNLNMSKNSKLVLIPILSMACVASLAVCVRMGFVLNFRNPDFLYSTVDIAVWTDIEQGLAITAGSLATLRPLYRIISNHLGISRASKYPKGSGGKESQQKWHRAPSSKPKRGGPFSLITMTTDEKTQYEPDSDEYPLAELPPPPMAIKAWKEQNGESRGGDSYKVEVHSTARPIDV